MALNLPTPAWPHTCDWLRRSFWDIHIEETRQMLDVAAAGACNVDSNVLAALAEPIGPIPRTLAKMMR